MSVERSRLLSQLAELLLHGAAAAPEQPVEGMLAEAVRRLMLSADITVIWRSHLAAGLTTAAGAACTDLTSPAARLDDTDARDARWPPLLSYPDRKQFTRAALATDAQLLLGLGQRDGGRINEIFVRVRADRSGEPRLAALAEAARIEFSQLAHLYKILSALQGASATRRQAAFRQSVARLLSLHAPDPLPHLPEATELLWQTREALAQPWYSADLLLLGEQIVEWCLHGLLGSGWSPRRLAAPSDQAAVTDFCAALKLLRQSLPEQPAQERWGLPLSARLGLLEDAITGQLPDQPHPALPEQPTALALLGSWSALHTCARAIDHSGRPQPTDDATWAATTAETRRALARLLAGWAGHRGADAPHTRNWLRLWFALQLLRPPPDHPDAPDRLDPTTLLGSERWRFRADLAYVLQECLRFSLYGSRPGYRSQPPAFSAALRTLVAHHARLEAGIPRELDVHSHLVEIAESDQGGGYRFAAGHLQHVLEIYIAGHFLFSLDLKDHDDTLGAVLASCSGSRPGRQATGELRAAFSLAALFHDTGAILFPRVQPTGEGLTRNDRHIKATLDTAEAALRDAGRALIERCKVDLTKRAVFETISEPGLVRWLEEQQASGQPDHGLLGAWLLTHRCEQAVLGAPVVQAAARAVLLHSAVSQPVDADRDPAAAVLLLCDELFDWEPSLASGPSPNAIGRSLHAAAAEHIPLRSRASALRLHGLRAEVTDDGDLRVSIERPDRWPRLSVALQPLGVMEEPAFRAWLTMAQNLGRLQPSQSGWGPIIELSACIPPRVAFVLGGTVALLDRAIHSSRLPSRTWLQSWLAQQETRAEDGEEVFIIRPTGRAMTQDNIRAHLPALKEEALRVLEELEQRAALDGHKMTP